MFWTHAKHWQVEATDHENWHYPCKCTASTQQPRSKRTAYVATTWQMPISHYPPCGCPSHDHCLNAGIHHRCDICNKIGASWRIKAWLVFPADSFVLHAISLWHFWANEIMHYVPSCKLGWWHAVIGCSVKWCIQPLITISRLNHFIRVICIYPPPASYI